MELSKSQRIILETILAHDGLLNWHKLGRSCLGKLDSPADFELDPLYKAGYLRKKSINNEPLERLYITDTGKKALNL